MCWAWWPPELSAMNPLDNIFWHTLGGRHADIAIGAADARRYAPGFSPIAGFADAQRPNFAALAGFAERGEKLYCSDWNGAAPEGWRIEFESTMYRMVWDADVPADDGDLRAVPLTDEHRDQAIELAALTRPGPFGPKTIEMGEYFGCFEESRLIAMAGERMQAEGLREVSGVCTHPDFQGRGLGRRLVNALVRRQLQRGDAPFLHVMRSNESAHALYQRIGFRDYRECVVRVVALG
jgi:ribosomal protein S18 acetylase RimI-like enzyme